MTKSTQDKITWYPIEWLDGFTHKEKVIFRDVLGFTWTGHYDTHESHKNCFGRYPVEIAKVV